MIFRTATITGLIFTSSITAGSTQDPEAPQFPVIPEVIADEPFGGCEGIAFNGEGKLFVTCNRALWRIDLSGDPVQLAELDSNLGLAGIGEEDLLVADFGPTNAFRHGRNDDGVVWRISPGGEKTVDADGMGDPNFIVVREDKSYLVSDDATADIYAVSPDGEVSLFSTAVNHPNGLAYSPDGSVLYVAQIFTNIRPVVFDNTVWAMRLEEGAPARDAKLIARTGPGGAPDGLAVDALGRVYIASNQEGRIWRFNPSTDEMVMIAENMFGVASLAFGEGDFDHQSIYATATFSGGRGGKVWRIPVGVKGAPLHR